MGTGGMISNMFGRKEGQLLTQVADAWLQITIAGKVPSGRQTSNEHKERHSNFKSFVFFPLHKLERKHSVTPG